MKHDNETTQDTESLDSSKNELSEIANDFRRFQLVRKFHDIVQRLNVILLGYAVGLALWGLAFLVLWSIGSGVNGLISTFINLIPFVGVSFVLFLLVTIVIALVKYSHRKIDLQHYIHWCDVEKKYDSELLTAFERMNSERKSEFDEYIEKKAIEKIKNIGVPQSFTELDIKRIYAFVGMTVFVVILLVIMLGMNQKLDSEDSKLSLKDDSSINHKNDDNKVTNNENQASSDGVNNENSADVKRDNPNPKDINKTEESEDKKEDKENKKEAGNDEKTENKESDNQDNENKNQPDEKKENSDNQKDPDKSDPKPPEDKAKFELDPKKLTPEASEDGETKSKKEKVYHLNENGDNEGTMIDPEKLLPNIKTSSEKVKAMPLSSQEKELIEKYRNMLEKNLSSR